MTQKRASQRKYHIVYRTTCAVTNRFYIGLHSTDDLADGYVGSGQRLWRSIKKHGKENHICEILEYLPTRKAASDREKELVDQFLNIDPLCLNLGPGGLGAFDRPTARDETRCKMSETHKKRNADPKWRADRWAGHKACMNRPEVIMRCSKAQLINQNRAEAKAKRSRPCTVDGITIFESIKALEQSLGKGKNGSRSPNLMFIEPNGPTKNVNGIRSAWADPIKRAARLEKRRLTLKQRSLIAEGK